MRTGFTFLSLSLLATLLSAGFAEEEKRLIKTSENAPAVWKTESEVLALLRNNKHFFDITDHQTTFKYEQNSRLAAPIPTTLKYQTIVNGAKQNINKPAMSDFLSRYSAIHNRYYTSATGVQASSFLLNEINNAAKGYTGKFSASLYKHTWAQPSVIAKFEGSDPTAEIIVIGAHLDSINLNNPSSGRAPGADDDGSGTTAVLETLRALAKANFKPKRTIEFQFYAAEEVGLRGSQAIAQAYAQKKVPILGMLQLDMTGYNVNKRIQLLTDYTDRTLSTFLKLVIDNYATYKWFDGQCGYACSDHASFNKAGYRSAQPGEDILNQRLHTTSDTTEFVNYDNVAEFVKLAIGFVVELAEPSN